MGHGVRDIAGERFGKLVAVKRLGKRHGHVFWEFKCDCGTVKAIDYGNAKSGSVISCGCSRSDFEKRYRSVKRVRTEQSQKTLERHKKYREKFLEMYGRECRCCGEKNTEFLTIEHINGQKEGKEHSTQAYRKACCEYRPDVYEILCMNCNHAKGRYGYCPHDRNAVSRSGLNSEGIPLTS